MTTKKGEVLDGSKPEASIEELAPVTKDYFVRRDWLQKTARNIKDGLLIPLREQYQKPTVVKDDLDMVIERYLSLKAQEDELKYQLVRVRQELACFWAQHGFQRSQKLTMITPLELALRVGPVKKLLTEEQCKQVTKTVEVFDLDQLLILADRGEVSQKLLIENLAGKVEIQPRKTKDASAPKDEEE